MLMCICIVVSIGLYSQLGRKHTEACKQSNKMLPEDKNSFLAKF